MRKVLVVDDDRAIIIGLGSILRASGYKVMAAQDAVSGTAMAVRESPDLVVLDICMPGGDGFTVARRLQDMTGTIGTPFIIISGSVRPEARKLADVQGAAAFFLKPVDPEKFIGAVRQALGDAPA
jgi:twitching motility two-component system response regulator PilH